MYTVDDLAGIALLCISDVFTSTNIGADEILLLFVEAKVTNHQYILIFNFVNTKTSSKVLRSEGVESLEIVRSQKYGSDGIITLDRVAKFVRSHSFADLRVGENCFK